MASADEVARDIAGLASKAKSGAVGLVGAYAQRLLGEVEGNARQALGSDPGMPDYHGSMGIQPIRAKFVGATVGTHHPGGFRSEQGFHGTDKRGAKIDQPPRPHWGPAADAVWDDFAEAVGELGLP
ncbi:MAG TPA: hypothetical protein VGB14_00350 [Acidimicrobiales bacterium]|jgi:hypothetical protein